MEMEGRKPGAGELAWKWEGLVTPFRFLFRAYLAFVLHMATYKRQEVLTQDVGTQLHKLPVDSIPQNSGSSSITK